MTDPSGMKCFYIWTVLSHQEAPGTIAGKECPPLKFFITMLKTTKIGNPAHTIFPKFHRTDLFVSVIVFLQMNPQTYSKHTHTPPPRVSPPPPQTWKYIFRLDLSNGQDTN
jgi:hypothetical protein